MVPRKEHPQVCQKSNARYAIKDGATVPFGTPALSLLLESTRQRLEAKLRAGERWQGLSKGLGPRQTLVQPRARCHLFIHFPKARGFIGVS